MKDIFKKRQFNNKGFSLVELIVTILILAIISGGAIVSIGVVYNANTDRAAKRLVMALSETREKAMAGDDESSYYLKLYFDDGDIVADICKESGGAVTVLESKEIGNKQVSIDVGLKNCDPDAYNRMAAGTDYSAMKFTFGKRRGELTETASIADDGTEMTGLLYVDLKVSGNITNEVIIVPATGRSYVYKD